MILEASEAVEEVLKTQIELVLGDVQCPEVKRILLVFFHVLQLDGRHSTAEVDLHFLELIAKSVSDDGHQVGRLA